MGLASGQPRGFGRKLRLQPPAVARQHDKYEKKPAGKGFH